MHRRTDARRGDVDLARIGFGIGDELAKRHGGKRWIDHKHHRQPNHAGDRRDIADEIEIELLVERRIDGVVRLQMVLMVNPSFPAMTLGEFIAYAKANPGKVNIASPGIGTPMHVGIELLKLMAGVDLVHIAYRGPAAVWPDLFSGQVQAFIITVSTAIGFIRAGKVRPLAVTVAKRTDVLPEIPPIAETLPGFEASAWNGIGAPTGTPAAIIDELSTNIVVGLADPQLKADHRSRRRHRADALGAI